VLALSDFFSTRRRRCLYASWFYVAVFSVTGSAAPGVFLYCSAPRRRRWRSALDFTSLLVRWGSGTRLSFCLVLCFFAPCRRRCRSTLTCNSFWCFGCFCTLLSSAFILRRAAGAGALRWVLIFYVFGVLLISVVYCVFFHAALSVPASFAGFFVLCVVLHWIVYSILFVASLPTLEPLLFLVLSVLRKLSACHFDMQV
jgi:hypothetical protein